LRPVSPEDEPVRGLDSLGVVLEVLLRLSHLDSEEEEDERTTQLQERMTEKEKAVR
jgi:hypothetical protein